MTNLDKKSNERLDQAAFVVEFAGPTFTDEERKILKESIREMRGTDIEFELVIIDKKLEPLSLLLEKLEKTNSIGDINILLHDRGGNIIGVKSYTQCQVYVSEFAEVLTCSAIFDSPATMRLSMKGYKDKKFNGVEIPA